MLAKIKKLFARSLNNPAVPLSSDRAYDYLVAPSMIGSIPITEPNVLAIPALYRALRLISSSIGRLDCDVFKRLDSGAREKYKDHPAYYLCRWQPNEYYHAQTFFETLIWQALLHGNGFAYVWRNGSGDPTELDLLPSSWVTPYRDGNGNLVYYVTIGTETRTIRPRDLIHVKGLCPDGLQGYSVCHVLREALTENLATQRYSTQFFRHNASPGLVVSLQKKLPNEEAVKIFRAGIADAHEGLNNAHRTMILQDGATLQDFSVDHQALQLAELREVGALAIANIFGLPPHKLGVKISSSYASIEAENKSLLTDSLEPWLCQLERELRSKLLREREKSWDTVFIEFDRSSYLLGDPAKKAEADTQKVYKDMGAITVDEVRARLNLPPLTDEQKAELAPPKPEPVVQELPPPTDPAPLAETQPLPARAVELLNSTLSRLGTRLGKSQRNTDDYQSWLDLELPTHYSVLNETLRPLFACLFPETDSDKIIANVVREIKHNPDEVNRLQWKHEYLAI